MPSQKLQIPFLSISLFSSVFKKEPLVVGKVIWYWLVMDEELAMENHVTWYEKRFK